MDQKLGEGGVHKNSHGDEQSTVCFCGAQGVFQGSLESVSTLSSLFCLSGKRVDHPVVLQICLSPVVSLSPEGVREAFEICLRVNSP